MYKKKCKLKIDGVVLVESSACAEPCAHTAQKAQNLLRILLSERKNFCAYYLGTFCAYYLTCAEISAYTTWLAQNLLRILLRKRGTFCAYYLACAEPSAQTT